MPPLPPSNGPSAKKPKLVVALLAALIVALLVAYFALHQAAPATPAISASIPATPPSRVPAMKKHLYSETADPRADIAAALAQAGREHKRVILDFGGDWCGDCQVLDIYFHQSPNSELLDKNFVVAHVWIGHMDTNLDLAAQYGVPVKSGVPALAVLGSDGTVLYAQSTGQFRDMRHMDADSVTDFLTKWKS